MRPTDLQFRLAVGGLAVLQVLHLLDSLRTDPHATFPAVLLVPQAVLGIGGALLALGLHLAGHRWARRIATVTAVLVFAGFVLVHGIPVASEATEPYWGEGHADALQWIGVSAVLAASVATIAVARREPPTTIAPQG